jgi:8-oxo-dGTP diphosphatase
MKHVAVELAVFTVRGGRLEALLLRRRGSVWALPGGPVGEGVTVERAALGALAAQTGVRGIALEQLYTLDRPPDGLAVAFLALIASARHPVSPGEDVVEARWFCLADLPPLAEEAAEVLRYAQARLRAKTTYAPIAFQLLPEVFTLGELQAVYEAVLETALDTRNFRRDVLAAGVVEPVEGVRAEGRGRPAQLYRSHGGEFAVVARERRIARALRRTLGAD